MFAQRYVSLPLYTNYMNDFKYQYPKNLMFYHLGSGRDYEISGFSIITIICKVRYLPCSIGHDQSIKTAIFFAFLMDNAIQFLFSIKNTMKSLLKRDQIKYNRMLFYDAIKSQMTSFFT